MNAADALATGIPMGQGLVVAGILFALGLAGLLIRRNIIYTLMCIEIMMNSAGLAFVVGASRWQQPDGQIMFLMILTLAAAETCVGLALVLQLYRRFRVLDIDAASRMRG